MKNTNLILKVLQGTWCLPQTLLGLILKGCGKGKKSKHGFNNKEYVVYNTPRESLGGISLGKYILLGTDMDDEETIKHEYGHQLQSYILGPLYLLVIGLPSGLWCGFVQDGINKVRKKRNKSILDYYGFYTESGANVLGKVKIEY